MKLAGYLEITPAVRLVVTAGLMKPEEAGCDPLPLPEDTRTRHMVKEQLMGIRGLTRDEKDALLRAYDNLAAKA